MHLTGLEDDAKGGEDLSFLFNQVHDFFAPVILQDAEMLYAVGLLLHLFSFLLGDEAAWNERSAFYRKTYRGLSPNGIDPAVFDGRGAYGN